MFGFIIALNSYNEHNERLATDDDERINEWRRDTLSNQSQQQCRTNVVLHTFVRTQFTKYSLSVKNKTWLCSVRVGHAAEGIITQPQFSTAPPHNKERWWCGVELLWNWSTVGKSTHERTNERFESKRSQAENSTIQPIDQPTDRPITLIWI